ncbi:MAG TPA: methylated-DNA--[protein]-cysteine S-methyltransferase [Mycobacteriales bacterium]|nr:methylated-DNA--[protein]-cysteine S-methyltransferase [Mycobacteriales bacterium]
MSVVRFAIFDTAVGCCAIAWADAGVVGTWLPGADPAATRRAVLRRHPDAEEAPPSLPVAEAIAGITRLLAGDEVDLRGVQLDMTGVPEFQQQVYAVIRALPRGVTMTYGEIAAKVGAPGAAQAVGQAMGHNPFPIVVPCHRVLAAGGANGGFSAPGGVDTKLKLLAIEGATLF